MAITRDALYTWLTDEGGLDRGGVTDDTTLFSDGLLDSLVMVDLIAWMEETGGFKMKWNEVTLDNLDTATRILAFAAARS